MLRTIVPTILAALLVPLSSFAGPAAVPASYAPASFDTTCSPCKDFDQFANGPWRASAKLPPGYASYNGFTEVRDRNQDILHRILDEAAADKNAKPGSDRAKLGTYYSSCMDSASAEAAGGGPVEGLLQQVAAMSSTRELAARVAWLHAQGIPALFSFQSRQDPGNSEKVIAFYGQGGLGLPDRDYYVRADSAAKAAREAYTRTNAKLLELSGEPAADAKRDADAVMALETALARISMTNVERRDPKATYNLTPAADVVTAAPHFAWPDYFAGRRIQPKSVNVQQPAFMRGMDSLVVAVPLETWKAYLRVRVLTDAAPMLSSAYVAQWFEMQTVLRGVTEMLPRWKRCVASTDRDLGEILGKEYIARAFSAEDKARMRRMVTNLEAALADRINAADWMGDSTRTQAHAKLDAFASNIGYPDKWRDYSKLEVKRGPILANHLASQTFESARDMSKIDKPVDRGEWVMTPPTVNAYYQSSLNSINFPAGILQPPFFDTKADDATNYGAIGGVIGHEMSHGFDDRGRQFDPQGNLRDWWTAADVERYKTRATAVAEQFNGYTVLDTLHVNGRLTLGENIGDLGGLAIAYAAMEKAYAGKSDRIGGFTPEQRFFLGWARVWREISTDASLRTLVLTNPHSPAHWRVNGPMSNLEEFRKAWGCKEGDAMVRPADTRVRIW